ncbi:MAG: hydrogenase maturation protein HypF, partial [Baekduia sp.]|nr:hydrogenase maturation protein HypF [Baekduia sp.]
AGAKRGRAANGTPVGGAGRRRVAVRVDGVVQGVGFRPFVYRLARDLALDGHVRNDTRGVLVEVEGDAPAVGTFLEALVAEAPPLAVVEHTDVRELPAGRSDVAGFTIGDSDAAGVADALVSADGATCADCLRELRDEHDRRHRYPFINCTNCGPRFTIVRGVPYDRPQTTMAAFPMCPSCRAEYDDPGDRRFHAQPNACPACGPRATLVGAPAPVTDAVAAAAALLRRGAIVAVKGLGGYHLACRADDAEAVATLRARKHREDKPFALMVADIVAARDLAAMSPAEEQLLGSPARPVVLVRRRTVARVAPAVAPGSRELGLMLPYPPLHHLLLQDTGGPIVLTSGNVSDEPIAYRDDDALERLGAIADAFLVHDRPIHMRTDDSVVRVVRDRPLVLRRSRGIVPESLALPIPCTTPVLAVGAQLKSAFCVAKGRRAWVGHHIGDLDDARTRSSFVEGIAHFERLFAVAPGLIAHDLHPDYASTAVALEREGAATVGVQHHHAHLAACLAEHGVTERAVGAIYDGAGLGLDGTTWGGELLVGDLRGFTRAGHLRAVRMPGGDRAARQPWRMAAAWLMACGGAQPRRPRALRDAVADEAWATVCAMAQRGFAAPETTSMGRLFDAVAALCGLRARSTYEGQAAVELESAAELTHRGAYELPSDDALVLDPRPLIRAVVDDVEAGTDVPIIAMRFHRAVAEATARVCGVAAGDAGLESVVLSGGVFQNRVLLELTGDALRAAGLRVLVPERLPPNDGGISYGQAAVAAATEAGAG